MMEEKEKLTGIDFWVDEKKPHVFSRHEGHGIDTFIRKYIPSTNNGNCLEIGSYPGPFLTTFGDLGYTLNGIDFHPDNKDKLPAWLNSLNYVTGSFVTQDFFEYNTKQQFDVVASFGFIEHFYNYENIILKHAELVKNKGYLIITTPNFSGRVQHFLHKTYDRSNLSFHNIKSMQPHKWALLLEQQGFRIIYQGYFGGFWFWRSPEPMNALKKKTLWLIERLIPRLRKVLRFQSPAFSAYCGIVAQKK